jgi:uncharacterized membrane protein YkgB
VAAVLRRVFSFGGRGVTVVEIIVAVAVLVAVAATVWGFLGGGFRLKSSAAKNDVSAFKVNVPAVTENMQGNYSITGTGQTGVPTNIQFN